MSKIKGAVAGLEVRQTRNGQHFATFTILHKNGRLPAKIWNVEETFKLNLDKVYSIEYKLESWQDQEYASVVAWRPVKGDVTDYLPQGPIGRNALRTMVKDLMTNHLIDEQKDLVDLCIGYSDAYWTATAASGIHHAYVGGLAMHSIEVATMALMSADARDDVDRGMLVLGGLLHDIGKIASYQVAPGFPMTTEGKLIGHIPLGYEAVARHLRAMADQAGKPIPAWGLHLLHIILGHHGQLEWGSPVIPQTVEAVIVSEADLMSSRVATAVETLESGKEWTDKMYSLQGAKLYLDWRNWKE